MENTTTTETLTTKPRLSYLRDANRNPIGCIASYVNKEDNSVSFAYAIKHDNDKFSKPLGKKIVMARLAAKPTKIEISESNITAHSVSYLIMKEIKDNSSVPMKARKAAKLWIKQFNSLTNKIKE